MQEKHKNIFSVIAALLLLSGAACVVTGADILEPAVAGGQSSVSAQPSAVSSQPVGAQPSTTSNQAGPLWVVAVDQAHLRSGPGLEHPATALLFAGQPVTITRTARADDGGLWANIASGELTGWVNIRLLELQQ